MTVLALSSDSSKFQDLLDTRETITYGARYIWYGYYDNAYL